MNTLKNKYDDRLLQYFSTFMNERINGAEMKIQPKSKDIPIIRVLGYDEKEDLLEVVFEMLPLDRVHKRVVEDIIFIEDDRGRLVAVQFGNFKKNGIRKIKLTLDTDLEREIKNISIGLAKGDGNISLTIIEKRKMKYIKEVIGNNLEEVAKIKIDSKSAVAKK